MSNFTSSKKMRPNNPPKRFGNSQNALLVGRNAKLRKFDIEDNPYKQGTDNYKLWEKGFRSTKSRN